MAKNYTFLHVEAKEYDESTINLAPATALTRESMVQCIEQVDRQHMSRHIHALRRFLGENKAFERAVAGAVVAVAPECFGTKLNVVVGLGTTGEATDKDLRKIEKFYSAANLPTTIELCPHADRGTIQTLVNRGYNAIGCFNVFIRSLGDISAHGSSFQMFREEKLLQSEATVKIVCAGPDDHETFIRCSDEGFKDTKRRPELREGLARSATLRPDTTVYLAKIDNKIAGTGALAILDTDYGRVGYLYIGSTLPSYRGQGIHRALDWARIQDARRNGCELAVVASRPGNASGRNAERLGFTLAYTKSCHLKGQVPNNNYHP